MKEFEVCVRAIVFKRDKILISHHKERNFYFFPGGHVNFGESIKEALKREIKEELGVSPSNFSLNFSLIGIVDNFYVEDGERHHEINFVFKVKIKGNIRQREIEETKKDHISFYFFNKKRFSKERVLPLALQKAILKWQKDKKFFWASQYFNKTILN